MSFGKKPKTPNYDKILQQQNKQFIQAQIDQQNNFDRMRKEQEDKMAAEKTRLKAEADQKTLDEINATNARKAKRRQTFLATVGSDTNTTTPSSFLGATGNSLGG